MLSILPGRVADLGDDGLSLLASEKHLLELLSIIRSHGKKLPASAIQAFHLHAKGYLSIMRDLGIKEIPKDHMLLEISARVAYQGSPQLYGCWHDEALNKLLKAVAGGAHPMVHERRILIQFPLAHDTDRAGLTATKRRRTD